MPLRDLGKPGATSEVDSAKQRNWLEQLRDVPFLSGMQVKCVVLAGQQTVAVRHGLDRTPSGALVLGSSNAIPVGVQLPEYATAPVDARKQIVVSMSATSGADTNITLWVF